MKIFLSNAAFHNRAPFEKLDLYFEENEIAVLTAINGRGKTTVLSHIVDAFHEMARPFFRGEYEGKENKLYRVSSDTENLDDTKPSLVYLRFKSTHGYFFDYVNIRGSLTEENYNAYKLPENSIPFNELAEHLNRDGYVKKVSHLDRKKVQDVFNSNVLTYFPSYRYEAPAYLNDPYLIELSFTKNSGFSGRLRNPIEVVSGLPQLANWLMDVALDLRMTPNGANNVQALYDNVCTVLTSMSASKGLGPLRFGIGPRSFGSTRIQIIEKSVSKTICPSIFGISSGESSMLCLFGELIRQADNNTNNIELNAITGIVVVDEVDKHLHIKLQKEILPKLFELFPNIQFILSSHSPFLSMGLADLASDRAKIIDLETFGISKDPTTNELYAEVYRMMIGENERFKELYRSLEGKVASEGVPLVITEGKTDVQHLRSASARLDISDCNVEFFDINGDWGDSKLKLMLEQLSKIPHSRKIIGIFDRDVPKIVEEIEAGGSNYKDYGNDVFALCLPVPQERAQYLNISLEFFYKDCDLRKEKNGKRLYFDNEVEFRQSAARQSERTLTRLENAKLCDENTKKIFDSNVGSLDWIHSKAAFSNLVENDPNFTQDFDFSNFRLIFDKLKEIIQL